VNDLNRYLSEAIRVRRTIQVYSELFDFRESIDALSEKSIKFTHILKRSMHDEILISLARMFDSDGYKTNGEKIQYLSQRNLVLSNEEVLSEPLNKLREKTSELWKEVSLKNYRDNRLAHNGKDVMLACAEDPMHNVTFEAAAALVDTSIQLILGIMCAKGETSLASNLNEKYVGVGREFIEALQKI